MNQPDSRRRSPVQVDSTLVHEAPTTGPGKAEPTEGESASGSPVDNGRDPPAGDLPQVIVDLTTADPSSAPAMPHERDETVGMTDGIPSKRVEQAYEDVEAGRQDTSRAVESDRTYQRQKLDG